MYQFTRQDYLWLQEHLPRLVFRDQLWEAVWRSELLNRVCYFSIQ